MPNFTPIPNFNGRYLLSDTKEVFRVNKPQVVYLREGVLKRAKMKPVRPFVGYGGICYRLWKNGKPHCLYLRQIVALCHVPNPKNKPHVKCLDGNPFNLSPSNLKWVGCPAGF